MPDANCAEPGCTHQPGFVVLCGYDEPLALASVKLGWAELVREALTLVGDAGGRVIQVKEKFAGLRVYAELPGADSESSSLVHQALIAIEHRSFGICELCGQPGSPALRGSYWRTLCPDDAMREGFVHAQLHPHG